MKKSSFGILGLGVMGKSLALNMLNNHIPISVYNRETTEEVGIVAKFLKTANNDDVKGFTDLEKFVDSIESPRQILVMVKAGKVIDHVIDSLLPYLEENDIIIDGGNSHYEDTARRVIYLSKHQINFIGLGVSGGEEGALKGPSLMPGGNKESYQKIASILERIAAKDEEGQPCCNYIGPSGAGHFVKMVHNGIEYGDMQLLAELYALLSLTKTYEEISKLFFEWNEGELASYLLEITSKILVEKEGNENLLNLILDKAGNKGTGSWSSTAALKLGVPTTVKTAAVYARYTSSFKNERVMLAKKIDRKIKSIEPVDLVALKEAYDFARTINLQQGLQLIKTASDTYNWNLNLAEICRVWSNGCIIKSKKIVSYSKVLQQVDSLFEDKYLVSDLNKQETAITKILQIGLSNRVNIPCFYEAYNYWISMTTAQSSANLIQAQRDFFGAHRFQKIGAKEEESFHHNWSALC